MREEDELTIKDVVTTLMPINTKRPVGDLNFHLAGKLCKFMPENATPRDMPYLLHLFIALSQPVFGQLDIEGYVEDHKLWHCFSGQQ